VIEPPDNATNFGLMLAGQFLPGADPVKCVEETIEQVRLAREVGLRSIWVTPRRVVFVAELPRTSSGKIQRFALPGLLDAATESTNLPNLGRDPQ